MATVLILDSNTRKSNSSMVEPVWELPSNMYSGILSVEKFNWNDIGYDLFGPVDYKLRIYADQYGSLLYEDKGSVLTGGAVVDFAPQVPVKDGTNFGKSVGVSGVAGSIIKLLGHDTVINDAATQGQDGSWINTHYVAPVDNYGTFTWTLLIKINPGDTDVLAQYSTNNNSVPGEETTIIGNYRHEPTETGPAYIAMWINDAGNIKIAERNTSSTLASYTTTVEIDDGFWHRLSFVSTSTHGILYIDGVEDGSYTKVGGVVTDTEDGTTNKLPVIINGALNRYWQGEISDVRLYERALEAAEIATLGGTPDTSIAYSNFASPLLINHNPTIRSDFISTNELNKFMYLQLFISQTHAKAMDLLEVRLLDSSYNNIFQDTNILSPNDTTNALEEEDNPSASNISGGDIESVFDNSIIANVIVGDASDGHDEIIQFKLSRSYTFEELSRLEIYFDENFGPHQVRFLNEKYDLIHTHTLYTSTPSYGDIDFSLVVLKFYSDSPMAGLDDFNVGDDVEDYVDLWADTSATVKYRKLDTIGVAPFRELPGPLRNRSLAMILPRGYGNGAYVDYQVPINDGDHGWKLIRQLPVNATNWYDTDDDLGYRSATHPATTGANGIVIGGDWDAICPGYDQILINRGHMPNYPALNGFIIISRSERDYIATVSPSGYYHWTSGTSPFNGYNILHSSSMQNFDEAGAPIDAHRDPRSVNIRYNPTRTFDQEPNLLWGDFQMFNNNNRPLLFFKQYTGSDPMYAEKNTATSGFGSGTAALGAQVWIRNSTYGATSTQGSYTPDKVIDGIEKQNDGQISFKFEKSDGTPLEEGELPANYSLMCHVKRQEGFY